MECRDQMARRDHLASGRRALSRRVIAVAMAVLVSMATRTWADTLLVPSLSVSERYDTNVFFVNEGQNLTDYVTTIAPSLRAEHKGRVVEGSLTGTLMGELYVKNPGLNYIGTSAAVFLNLDQVVGRLDRRATLTISDSFSYTPRPPGFLSPDSGGAVPPEFVRGIQTMRANSITNIGSVIAGFGLTQASRLIGTYTDMYMRFGNAFIPTGGASAPSTTGQASPFFTTRFQTITVGPEIKVTARDVATISFQRMEMNFLSGTEPFGFVTLGGLAGWKRALSQEFTASVALGIAILTPGNDLQQLANASLEWKRKKTTVTVGYSRTIFPSFFIAAAPLASQNFGITATYKLTEALMLNGSANYALNETVSGPPVIFKSYAISVGMSYNISRTLIATASYTHSDFYYLVEQQDFGFNRDVLMASLRKEWR